jgi:hypothetical protein
MRFFICPLCKKELPNDIEKIHGHCRSKHSEIIVDQYTITVINLQSNWIEKEE